VHASLATQEPAASDPRFSIETTLRGADLATVDRITQQIEDRLASADGVEFVLSTTRAGASRVTVKFQPSRDADQAAARLQELLGRVRHQLPAGVEGPAVTRLEGDAQPVAYLGVRGAVHDLVQSTEVASRIRDRLQRVSGVGTVHMYGAVVAETRIWLDRERLARYRLTAEDLATALRRHGAGTVERRRDGGTGEYIVPGGGLSGRPERIEPVVVNEVGGVPVYVRDVGHVELGPRDDGWRARINGNAAVVMEVVGLAEFPPADLTRVVHETLAAIRNELPVDLEVKAGYSCSRCAALAAPAK
jgi:multidrug efflux pump subunit AcrB